MTGEALICAIPATASKAFSPTKSCIHNKTPVWALKATTSPVEKGTTTDQPLGNYYSNVWNAADKPNVIGIVGFFLFVVAAALMLVNFLPIKARKGIAPLTGLMFIGAGVLFLMTPGKADIHWINMELTGSLIAMAVLVIIAGALSLAMAALDFTNKKAE